MKAEKSHLKTLPTDIRFDLLECMTHGLNPRLEAVKTKVFTPGNPRPFSPPVPGEEQSRVMVLENAAVAMVGALRSSICELFNRAWKDLPSQGRAVETLGRHSASTSLSRPCSLPSARQGCQLRLAFRTPGGPTPWPSNLTPAATREVIRLADVAVSLSRA